MNAGSLRHKVTIEKPKRVSDTFGESSPEWEALGDIRASIEPLRAAERFRAARNQHETTHLVRARYTELLTAACRLRWNNGSAERLLSIQSLVNVGERNHEVEMLCTEINGA